MQMRDVFGAIDDDTPFAPRFAVHGCPAETPWGKRAYGHVPRDHTRNTTLVAALTFAGLDAPMVLEGAMDREAFVAWLTRFPVPTLAPGQVVAMDNLSVHKGAQVRQLIDGAACASVGRALGSIPASSPDFTPIEGAYSKVKTLLRRAAKRTQAALEGAIGEAVEAVTASDARGWFTHCGYRLPTGRLT